MFEGEPGRKKRVGLVVQYKRGGDFSIFIHRSQQQQRYPGLNCCRMSLRSR
jgi:hypothetical protein